MAVLFLVAVPAGFGALVRGPYLQSATAHSTVLRWRTDTPTATVVSWGTNLTQLDQSNTTATLTTEHGVTLANLEPDTRYFYAVASATAVLAGGPQCQLVTAPLAGTHQPVRIWVLGDSGHSSANASKVRDAYLAFTGARRTDAILMLGDNAAPNGTDSEMQAAVFNPFGDLLRQTCLWPALGNHDTAGSANPLPTLAHFANWTLPTAGEAGGAPSGTEKYFSFNLVNVHFVCLDSMSSSRSLTGPMIQWLREDLSANRLEWVIAYWHHPPHSKGAGNADSAAESVQMREAAARVLEEHGADLVMSGHSHSYERSCLMDGHYGPSSTFTAARKVDAGDGRETGDGPYRKLGAPAPHQGTVYLVLGCSSDLDGGALNHPAMVTSLNVLGSLVLDVDGGRLDAQFLDANGAVRDHFTMLKTFPNSVLITAQPTPQAVESGATATFNVGAISVHPITYQWRKDGMPLDGATNAARTIPNVQAADEGFYDVIVADPTATLTSEPAWLGLRVFPDAITAPLQMTVVEGGNVTLSLESVGTLPLGYRWRRDGRTIANCVRHSHQSFYTITNAQAAHGGLYTVALTNAVFYQPGILRTSAVVTVLADRDQDGLPDAWEQAHGLDADTPADAGLDSDNDGRTHGEEYLAGTDPRDAASALRVEEIRADDHISLHFPARSNRTYTVQYHDHFPGSAWTKLADVVASPTNRAVVVTDLPGPTNRYYRVLTPRQP